MSYKEMKLRGRNDKWYDVLAVANMQSLKNDYKETIMNYNGYVVSSLDKLKNTNNKNIFFIIESNIYYVVTNQTIGSAMEEFIKKHNGDK